LTEAFRESDQETVLGVRREGGRKGGREDWRKEGPERRREGGKREGGRKGRREGNNSHFLFFLLTKNSLRGQWRNGAPPSVQ